MGDGNGPALSVGVRAEREHLAAEVEQRRGEAVRREGIARGGEGGALPESAGVEPGAADQAAERPPVGTQPERPSVDYG